MTRCLKPPPCWLVLMVMAGTAQAQGADEPLASLPEVTVQAPPHGPPAPDTSPGTFAPARVLDLEEPGSAAALDQALIDQGWGTWDAGNSLGLAQGLQVRGFALSNQGVNQVQATRILINGHADIAWRFARDAATLESAQLLGGHDATLLGAGAPGATLMLRTKAPTGTPFQRLRVRLGDDGGWQGMWDAEHHIGPLQLRAVLSGRWGDTTVEGVRDSRRAALLSARLPLAGGGHVQWDLEQHVNRMPFPFGTAYAGGRFWLDHSYVDTARASADRRAWRQALYLERPLGSGITLKGHLQAAHTQRDETLVGFFDAKNDRQLNGYLRQIDENYRQRDAGLQLDGQFSARAWQHQWSLALGTHRQRRDFAGPQRIGGFTLDLAAPVFPPDLSVITLDNRFVFDRLSDTGLGFAWRAQSGPWDLRAGLRHSRIAIDASNSPSKAPAPVSRGRPLTHALGAGYTLGTAGRLWLARTQSYLPNRGQLFGGDWLPASSTTQWEAGWAWPAAPANASQPRLAVTLFDLHRSNLPASDPAHADYYILRGAQRSRGLELQTAFATGALRWTLAATWQRVRITGIAAAAQAPYLPGVPARFGSLHVQAPVPGGASAGLQAWARLTASATRPGDDKASFSAPGWSTMDAGLRGHWPGQPHMHWGLAVTNVANRSYVRALTGPDNVWQGPARRWQARVEAEW